MSFFQSDQLFSSILKQFCRYNTLPELFRLFSFLITTSISVSFIGVSYVYSYISCIFDRPHHPHITDIVFFHCIIPYIISSILLLHVFSFLPSGFFLHFSCVVHDFFSCLLPEPKLPKQVCIVIESIERLLYFLAFSGP